MGTIIWESDVTKLEFSPFIHVFHFTTNFSYGKFVILQIYCLFNKKCVEVKTNLPDLTPTN